MSNSGTQRLTESLLQSPLGPVVETFCIHRKFLVYNLVSRNLKTKYRRSLFGIAWTLLNPLAISVVYYLVFKFVFKAQVSNYGAYIVSGMFAWIFFSQTLAESLESITGNLGLITKVPIPLQIFPFVGTVTNFINLLLALPIIGLVIVASDLPVFPQWVLLPFYLLSLFLITFGLSIIFSLSFVLLRDLKHILGIVLQIWLYATPVFYSVSMVPEKLLTYAWMNPLFYLFTGIRDCILLGVWPHLSEALVTAIWTLVILVFAIFFRIKTQRFLVERL